MLAYPWESDEVISSKVKGYNKRWMQPNRDRIMRVTRSFMKDHLGSTTWGEVVLMCGNSTEAHDLFMQIEFLNHDSSMALRNWSRMSISDKRNQAKEWCKDIKEEKERRRRLGPPFPGAFVNMPAKGMQLEHYFRNWSDSDLHKALQLAESEFDLATRDLQEGKLTNGTTLTRPYRSLPMFVGLLLTGFQRDWITQSTCIMRGNADNIARCCWCQCGICETHGVFLSRASQQGGEWKGSSTACCDIARPCKERQRNILKLWKIKTGEVLIK